MSLFLALRLRRPLFLEGEAGVGKTALAAAVAAALDTDLIRLQCYEGLDISHAVYEWDYARQLLELRILEAAGAVDRDAARRELYSDAFLIKRPLLQAIDPGADPAGGAADRRDRSRRRGVRRLSARAARRVPDHDSRARHRARHRAAARHPHVEPHARGARRAQAPVPLSVDRVPVASTRSWRSSARGCPTRRARLAAQVTALVQELRGLELYKVPGVSETLDWVAALVALDQQALDPAAIEETLGVVLKAKDDIEAVRGERAGRRSLARACAAADASAMSASCCSNLLVLRPAAAAARPRRAHRARMLDVVEALQHVDLGARDEVYHTCRALLVHRHEDLAIFDRAFDAFWRARDAAGRGPEPDGGRAGSTAGLGAASAGRCTMRRRRRRRAGRAAAPCARGATSRRWRTRTSPSSRRRKSRWRARRSIGSCGHPGERRTRRWVAGRGPRIDLRRALARSVRTGGDVFVLPRRRRRAAAATDRPAVRRQRIDGALLAHAAALRPCDRPAPSPRRGVPVLDAADAHHPAAARPPARSGGTAVVARGARLVGRHAHRRGAAGAASAVGRGGCCTAARWCC